jgi:UDP-N-acetylmuramate: L-alanyl-gamma-D-glutamyl-meso-diaminopimelate ligase
VAPPPASKPERGALAAPAQRQRIHLIGICGTGMGSLAVLLQEAGHEVRGSDTSIFPPMSTLLAARGIRVLEGFRPEHLDDRPDLVIVGNVATRTNPEAVAAGVRGLPYLSMPQAIGRLFLEGRHSIVIAGTHGKTTTSALRAWVLHAAGRRPSFLVGGVLCNFNGSSRLDGGPDFVIEGDEYETSFFDKGPKFLHYRPQTAILTSVEFDHAEMFADLEAVKEAFRRFVRLLPPDGRLFVCGDDPGAMEVSREARCRIDTYGLGEGAAWRGRLLGADASGSDVEVRHEDRVFTRVRAPFYGVHNLRNLLAVVAAAHARGLDGTAVASAVTSFAGVRRRQEVRGVEDGVTVVDDFAHHPTAVRLTLEGLRLQYGSRRLWAVFEPRTNTTRRSVFQQEYAEAFDAADQILLAAVDHPERAPEGQRFSAEKLVEDLNRRGRSARYVPSTPAIVSLLARECLPGDVVVGMSNGSFAGFHALLLEALKARARADSSA